MAGMEGGDLVLWLWGLAVLLLDLVTKGLVLAFLDPGDSLPVIDGVFHLTLVLNPGGAFGMGAAWAPVFIPVAILALGLVLYYGARFGRTHPLMAQGLGLIAGGTAGNLLDRLRWGQVVDFLDFRFWPVFNVADMALTGGSILLLWFFWKGGGSRES